ncbi:CHASE4 domain-containing protein [Leptolyngbya sp. AN02str]|uniref:CHASE4 domain-containing protein n=1 Tax=Leptolyngbya sp. AN02str TaxID=3423363 RepID=UPI003D31125E
MQYRRTSLLLGLGLAGATALSYTIAASVLMSSFFELEKQSTLKHVQRTLQTLDTALSNLSTTTGDYARWDDTYQYAQDLNPTYIDNNLNEDTFTSLELNLVAVIDRSGQILHIHGYDLEQGVWVNPSPAMRSQLVSSSLVHRTQSATATVGILNLPQGPMLVASQPITTSDGSSPIRGSLIMGQWLNRAKLDAFEQLTQVSLDVRSLNQPILPNDFATAKTNLLADSSLDAPLASSVQALSSNTIAGYHVVYDLSNTIAGYHVVYDLNQTPAFLMRVSLPRAIYRQGLLSLRYLAASIGVIGGLAGVAIWLMVKKTLHTIAERDRIEQTRLRESETKYRLKAQELEHALAELQKTQTHLIQSEKMSSLGQLVAGITHEINNPLNFISGNIRHAEEYLHQLFHLLQLYAQRYPTPAADIHTKIQELDLDFIQQDFPNILRSMSLGASRIQCIIKSLRNFSHLHEAGLKSVDVHAGLETTLQILQSRLDGSDGRSPAIHILRRYSDIPPIQCYPSEINQVFLNLLTNAIDALSDLPPPATPTIRLETEPIGSTHIRICIANNGPHIPATVQSHMFNPFFTTKPIGKGTGLGLTTCYHIIVDRHHGVIECNSMPNQDVEFTLKLPMLQPSSSSPKL